MDIEMIETTTMGELKAFQGAQTSQVSRHNRKGETKYGGDFLDVHFDHWYDSLLILIIF